ncbi:NAD(P)-dependent oxidoreductase [Marinivivus vitaminiproducens]|uniref:NAD(P)-dependent oxidoreductase n=1 Tax=Marinivivus vitaminiproducens TaxID=3035935 RepID=UPI0027AB1D93|nr:NAD(P)-dependent oxidoreductase [Geminicoccaceae bacterium SCSIO 64248]
MSTHIQQIAFLGTGLMGAPMARCLLHAGFPVRVWNRTGSKAAALVEDGAVHAASAVTAVAGADLVITMLENGSVVGELLFDGGVARAARNGAVFVDMSSVPPEIAQLHATMLLELGQHHIDAPVSGGTAGAAAGTLAIMAGGDAETFQRVEPVLRAMGRPVHVGPSGSGQLAKLANQVIVAVSIGAVAEALLLAAAGGADPAAVREALRGGFAESRILELHGQRMLDRDFVPGGAIRNQLKDLDTALAAASNAKLKLPMLEVVRAAFAGLKDTGAAGYDHSALLLWLEQLNAPARVGDAPDRLPS